MTMFDNKNILITGGTGSFGVEFVKKTRKLQAKKADCLFQRRNEAMGNGQKLSKSYLASVLYRRCTRKRTTI